MPSYGLGAGVLGAFGTYASQDRDPGDDAFERITPLPPDRNAYLPNDVMVTRNDHAPRVEQASARSYDPASNSILNILDSTAKKYGIDPATFRQFAQIESNFNPREVSPTGAKGLFQFTDGTARLYGVRDPFDPAQNADGAARLFLDNKASLTAKLGRQPTAGEIYLAHQQGGAGAAALLKNPGESAIDALAPIYGGNRAKAREAIRVNGGSIDMTAGDFAGRVTSAFGGNATPAPAAVSRAEPPRSTGLSIEDDTRQMGVGYAWGKIPKVKGLIIHHTGGGGDTSGVISTLKQRQLGAQFVIDREGNAHQLLPDGAIGRQIKNGWGDIGRGFTNQNTIGVEVIAKNDKDVLPVQVEAAKRLAAQLGEKYGFDPTKATFGHGQVNPGHKEADEGMTVVNAIRGGDLPTVRVAGPNPQGPANTIKGSGFTPDVKPGSLEDIAASGGSKLFGADFAPRSAPVTPAVKPVAPVAPATPAAPTRAAPGIGSAIGRFISGMAASQAPGIRVPDPPKMIATVLPEDDDERIDPSSYLGLPMVYRG